MSIATFSLCYECPSCGVYTLGPQRARRMPYGFAHWSPKLLEWTPVRVPGPCAQCGGPGSELRLLPPLPSFEVNADLIPRHYTPPKKGS